MNVRRVLTIRLPARPVGELSQTRAGSVRWRPDSTWESEGQSPRLGLDFLRSPGPRDTSGELPAWFENLLPERETALRARLCAVHGLREAQSYALLAAVGRDLPGAVEVLPLGTPSVAPEGQEPGVVEEPAPEREHLSALAGNQLKFSMSMVGDRLTLGASAGSEQWIVKFPGRDFPDLPEVEHATMSWARAAGFDVPHHHVVAVERLEGIPPAWVEPLDRAGYVFAIRRFDRRTDGSKIHHEDLCQALALRPANKYGDLEPGVSFEGALRLVVDACGEDEGRELARRMGFVIASGNGDAHLKNWSIVWGERTRPASTASARRSRSTLSPWVLTR